MLKNINHPVQILNTTTKKLPITYKTMLCYIKSGKVSIIYSQFKTVQDSNSINKSRYNFKGNHLGRFYFRFNNMACRHVLPVWTLISSIFFINDCVSTKHNLSFKFVLVLPCSLCENSGINDYCFFMIQNFR